MNDLSKLMLSDEEQQLVNNRGWILTKRIIMDKVNGLFGSLSADLKKLMDREQYGLPVEVVSSTPKISKGENYLQLPYLLLDYPRCFGKENIFAVRTMFWWGNFFSMTLHLSGSYKEMFQQKIYKNLNASGQEFFICINESQWHAHFETDNFMRSKQIPQTELEAIIFQKKFLKLAIKFPLHQWADINNVLEKSFKEIMEMLKD